MKWKPLHKAIVPDSEREKAVKFGRKLAKEHGFDEEKIVADVIRSMEEVWRNDVYQVAVTRQPWPQKEGVNIVHLSIKRIDRKPSKDWRDFQRIKNQLVGPECEAIELYPAESRVVDTANQYHLWALDDPNILFPFGFDHGMKLDHNPDEVKYGVKQRKF